MATLTAVITSQYLDSVKRCGRQPCNLTHKRFGRLFVEGYHHGEAKLPHGTYRFWLCKCDCGNICVVRGHHLLIGKSKSCGCLRKELTGERFTKTEEEKRITKCLKKMKQHWQKTEKTLTAAESLI